MLSNKRTLTVGVFALSSALVLGACSGAGGGSSDNGSAASGGNVTLNLATVNNGQMKDMEKLKTEYETANPGTKVNFQVMEEGDLRSAVTADVASGAGQYDIVTIGAYETPQWGANGWLVDLTEPLKSDAAYDVDDLLPPVRDALTNDGQAVRGAVLRRVLDPHVQQGGPRQGRRHAAGATRPGSRSPTRPRRSRPPTWPASACAASPAGATCSHR